MYNFIRELGKIDIEYSPDDSEEKKIIFKSYIKSVENNYVLVDFLSNKGTNYHIPHGKQIKVKFKATDGIHHGICEIIGEESQSVLSGIKISYPENIQFIQQREYVRVPLKLRMEIVIFFDETGEKIITMDIKTIDISGSGLCFVTDDPLREHRKAVGFVYLQNSDGPPIQIELKHVYSREIYAAGKTKYKNAFTFMEIDEKLREKLLREIFLFQLEMKKNKIFE